MVRKIDTMTQGMFVLGHVGIGRRLVGSRGRRLPTVPLVVGMVLPDLIDKPLYYWHFSEFISCTRTFGHTGLLLALVCAVAASRKSAAWLAVGLGMSTHLLLDWTLDVIFSKDISAEAIAFAWPFWYTHFLTYDVTPLEHLGFIFRGPILTGEIVGLSLLVWEYVRRRR